MSKLQDQDEYECAVCGETYDRLSNLAEHWGAEHGEHGDL